MGAKIRSKLATAADAVWREFTKCCGGIPDSLELAILKLRIEEKEHEIQTSDERRCLVAILNATDNKTVNAAGPVYGPELAKALRLAREVVGKRSDMEVVQDNQNT